MAMARLRVKTRSRSESDWSATPATVGARDGV